MDLGRDQIAIGSTVGMDPDECLYHEADDSDLDEQTSQESVDVVDNLHDLDQFFVSRQALRVWEHAIYLRYGGSAMRMPNRCLTSHLSMGIVLLIPNCPRIMERMTECCTIRELKNTSTWIHSSQQRRGASPLVAIYVANSS